MGRNQLLIQIFAVFMSHLALGHACAVAPASSPELSEQSMIAAGAKRFNQNCVYCHGNAGSGGKAGSLQNRDDLTKEYVFNTISNGKTRGSFLMPAWKASFSEQEILELTSYILSLKNVGPQR